MVGLTKTLFCLGIVLALGGIGCQVFGPPQTDQQPLKAPELVITSRVYSGSILSGPTSIQLKQRAFDSVWMISTKISATESFPTQGFERLARQARLVFATRQGTPVVPSARLSSELMIREISPADVEPESQPGEPTRQLVMSELTSGVVPGTTLEIDIHVPSGTRQPHHPVRSGVKILIARSDDSDRYSFGVASQNLIPRFSVIPTPPNDQDWVSPPTPPSPERVDLEQETLLTDRILQRMSDRWLLVIPMTFEDSTTNAIVVDLTVQAQPEEPDREAIVKTLQSSLLETVVSDDIRSFSSSDEDELRIRSGLEGLSRVIDTPRGALVYLAGLCGAELTETVAITADPSMVQTITQAVLNKSPGLSKVDRTNVAWLLDRTTVETLNALKNDASRPMSSGIDGVLAEYAGEVGRQIDALQSLVSQSTGPEDLKNRLIAENLIYLEDSSPSARVRAYDWLNRQGLAPEGYDPLALPRERRRALERAAERRQTLSSDKQP